MATLGDYKRWLESIGGRWQHGIAADEVIGMVPVLKLVAPGGRYVIHGDTDENEVLSSLTIEYFDRRLLVLSPFRSTPRA
jgi:hypothetical protein